MRRFYPVLFIILFLLTAKHGLAQYYFQHYQVDNGLVHNSVTTILQDRRGFIWVGTRGGLSRFDGHQFKTFRNTNNQIESIRGNIFNAIKEDNNGIFWMATSKGLFRFDPSQEKLTSVAPVPDQVISHLEIDGDNRLWMLINHVLYTYDPGDTTTENTKIKGSCIALGRNNELWIGQNDGTIERYVPNTRSINSTTIIEDQVPDELRSISKIHPIDDNKILIGCFGQGLKLFEPATGTVTPIPLTNEKNNTIFVRDITVDADQKYWIATESGIFIYNPTDKSSQHLRKQQGDPYSITDNAIYALCEDSDQGMWVGTYYGGLQYYSKQNARFTKYYPLLAGNSISGEITGQIVPDQSGNIWIGTEDAGINKLNLKSLRFTHYPAKKSAESLSYPNIHGLLAVGKQLYIGPYFHGMEIMDMQTGQIRKRYSHVGTAPFNSSNFISSFYFTRDSTLLVGTAFQGAGLYSYDLNNGQFEKITQIPDHADVLDILEDHNGTIWTGSTSGGAFYYNPTTGKKGNIHFRQNHHKNTKTDYTVLDIFESTDGFIWFATAGGGLFQFSSNGQFVQQFTTKEGLPTNIVYCILEDDKKNLWISSLKGLIRLNPHTGNVTHYTKNNGLITNQFCHRSAYKAPNGQMFFGSVKGMICFDPKAFEEQEIAPPTYITGLQINNQEISVQDCTGLLSHSMTFTDSLRLKYNQNSFNISFAALDYSAPDAVQYQYKLEGVDQDWTVLFTNRPAYYTDLAPGEYEFQVQAKSSTGNWVGATKKLLINIEPPFWKTTMAYLIYFLCLAGTTYWMVHLQLQRIELRNQRQLELFKYEKEKEIYQAKIDFFTNITHEIKTPLTLIVGPIGWLKKQFSDNDKVNKSLAIAERNTNRLIELTNQLLDFRKTEADQFSLNFVNTDISALLTDIVNSFKQEAQNNNIDLKLVLPPAAITAYSDREALTKICNNLIANAVKYGEKQVLVKLSYNERDAFFTIHFQNDGQGINEEYHKKIFEPFFRIKGTNQPGTGIGLPLALSLTELHNGTLSLINATPGKVIFELKLPIRQSVEFQLSAWKKT